MTTKTVLITGANRGIGLGFVEYYMHHGWHVIAAVRNVDRADQLRALSPSMIVALDVGDEASIAHVAEQLKDQPIDLLINNAGIYVLRDTCQCSESGSSVTVKPTPLLAADTYGIAKVANVSSFMGSIELHTTGGLYGYASSKAALNMINKALSVDLKPYNIAAIVLHPGYVATDINYYQGTMQPKDSVEGMAKVIDNSVTIETSGQFIQYTGEPLPW